MKCPTCGQARTEQHIERCAEVRIVEHGQGLRCQDKLLGTQCEEPLGHFGQHLANKGTLYLICWTWSKS